MTRNDLIMECNLITSRITQSYIGFLMSFKKSFYLLSSAFIFMLRALRGYQALQVTMLLYVVVNYSLVKPVNVLTIDS